ncbi:hypothetical protein [Phascolarctobacterium sp.]|uniref:hypothetical protein n=1 Tax=Phascolarctobacterium sp. TaxID=2049039 RepID=UPI0030783B49
MYFDNLSTIDKEKYLLKPILQVLQEAGGQLERSEIKNRIMNLDEGVRTRLIQKLDLVNGFKSGFRENMTF